MPLRPKPLLSIFILFLSVFYRVSIGYISMFFIGATYTIILYKLEVFQSSTTLLNTNTKDIVNREMSSKVQQTREKQQKSLTIQV